MRFIGFLAVVLLHVVTHATTRVDLGGVIDHAMRFAVPVFFMISGYFAERGARPPLVKWLRTFKRLAAIFLFWELVYNLADTLVLHTRTQALLSLGFLSDTLYSGGVAWHLWFLPSLALSLAVFLSLRRFGWPVLLAATFGLYLVGLAVGPYGTALGISSVLDRAGIADGMELARTLPLMGPIFVGLGAFLSTLKTTDRWVAVLLLAVCGLLLQMAEAGAMTFAHGLFAPYDFLLGTLPFALGAFLVLRVVRYPAIIAYLGGYALGMYCCHILVLSLVNRGFDHIDWAGRAFARWPLTFAAVAALSILLTMALARIRALRAVIS